MYIDLIIVIVLLLLVIFVFRKFSSFVYALAIIDIFLRIIDYLRLNVPLKELGNIFPSNIPAILDKYTDGMLLQILMWIYVFIYVCFLVYITNYFIHKRK
ncbi:MAG: hypothetical protein IJ568_06550 [Bacilli bacterium]|nr:hypothetical protein [Bacilli bacterium]